ncbi:MAG TPA: 2'-5' RNA ligase family protein [Chitinophagaceae bacterium]|nr:2'-5' RNA ligase family protein [Chitinophagaceae bacterium]
MQLVQLKPIDNDMEQNTLKMPGYAPYEYLLVLEPHEELKSRIQAVKEEFAGKYQHEMAKWTKPHITLVNFVQYAMMEQRIINKLKLITMGLPPIKVELKDFGSFPTHTIYINITSKAPVINMVKALRQSQSLLKINNDNKPHFITEPHLTVARKLQPWQFEKGWLEYEHKHFSGRFIANHLLLLKRRAGDKKYQVAAHFPLENLPVVTTQGVLF